MQMVKISQITRDLIRANTTPGATFRDTAKLINNEWHIPLDDEVIARLEQHRMPGETLNDVIQRACSTMGGRARQ